MWFYNLLFTLAFAQVDRLSLTQVNLSQVDKIYLSPGLVSVLEFPQNIIEVRVGNPKSVKAIISQVSPKELTVYLSSGSSSPSNIIVRSEKRVFVFDVVPSRIHHQDYVRIRGAYGEPKLQSQNQSYSEQIKMTPSEIRRQPSSILKSTKILKVGP